MRVLGTSGLSAALAFTLACPASGQTAAQDTSAARLSDNATGRDWAAFGRTFGEQHYSPLAQIDAANVSRLGLAWSMDLGRGNSSTVPLAVDGILYFASGLSVVHAVEAATGKLLWIYDPQVAAVAGHHLEGGWGSRGIAYWNGKIYTGTIDGRLIAVDIRTGKPVWSTATYQKEEPRYITGPPRVFDGKVIVGHGGADWASIRGYVTTYDAETGRQLWRFHVVPGNPADGFEDKAMEVAAKTWSGEWWKYGGGGTVWNAITYDAEMDTIYLGTGNGAPWNYRFEARPRETIFFFARSSRSMPRRVRTSGTIRSTQGRHGTTTPRWIWSSQSFP